MRSSDSQSTRISCDHDIGQEENTRPLKSGHKLKLAVSPVTFPTTSMKFAYPQMRPTWQFMPFMPTYQSSPPIYLLQLQMALQCNATLMPAGNETFVPLLIPQLEQYHAFSASRHHDRARQHERGQYKTAAPTNNHDIHASFGTMTNDHRAILHHRRVEDGNNARSGLEGGPPSSGSSATPSHKPRSRATLQHRGRRASATRGQRKCDDLLQYVVASEDTESGRPWKRRRTDGQPMTNNPVLVASTSPPSVAIDTSISDEEEQRDIPMDGFGDVDVHVEN